MDSDAMKAIWVVLAVALAALEIVAPGFVLLPFGIGAGGAAIAAFAGAELPVQLAVFLVTSAAAFAALRPLARRLNAGTDPQGVGANRLLGQRGLVLEPIDPDRPGLVRLGGEEWRAEPADDEQIQGGRHVEVVDVRGTRVVVRPVSGAGPETGGR